MCDEMVTFEKDEFEVAIITYNRMNFVKEWLNKTYDGLVKRNISISIYDSSTNEETEDMIKLFNIGKKMYVNYVKLEPSTILGYKPMIPIFASQKKYIWICGDSRRHNLDEMDEKVFPYIKDGYDYVQLLANPQQQKCKSYSTNALGMFIRDCFLSSTCIGFSIYKTNLFSSLKKDKIELDRLNSLFSTNYGFGWLGYFYSTFAKGYHTARTCSIKTIDILKHKKKQVWAKKFFHCWIDDMCQIIDNIPTSYDNKNLVPKLVWKDLNLCSDQYLYIGRKVGDLNKESYERYVSTGLLARVIDDRTLFKFYAKAPIPFVEVRYRLYKLIACLNKCITYFKRKIMRRLL